MVSRGCEGGGPPCQPTSSGSEESSLLQRRAGKGAATWPLHIHGLPYSNGKGINSPADVVKNFNVSLSLYEPYGVERLSFFVNGQFGAPPLFVTEGDLVEVTITNALSSQGTTMHWHGIWQNETNEMDGVDAVTQCSFPPGTTFTYRFVAYPAGTHWYPSPDGVQYADGLSGPLIVEPKTPPDV